MLYPLQKMVPACSFECASMLLEMKKLVEDKDEDGDEETKDGCKC